MILNNSIYYCNILVFFALIAAYIYVYNNKPKEGIKNMNCCGGIQAGKHYSETDKVPPRFVRRCFKSSRKGGEVVYEWDGYPCSTLGSKNCCDGGGKCTPSTKGGYCTNNNTKKGLPSTYIYRRGSINHSSFIPTSNDIDLDLNNSIQMKKYFNKNMDPAQLTARQKAYNKNKTKIRTQVTKRMQDILMKRKTIIDKNRSVLESQAKQRQILSTITIIYLIFLVIFSIIIKDQIIYVIDSFYNSISMKVKIFQTGSN